jgi:hypothetical protein
MSTKNVILGTERNFHGIDGAQRALDLLGNTKYRISMETNRRLETTETCFRKFNRRFPDCQYLKDVKALEIVERL